MPHPGELRLKGGDYWDEVEYEIRIDDKTYDGLLSNETIYNPNDAVGSFKKIYDELRTEHSITDYEWNEDLETQLIQKWNYSAEGYDYIPAGDSLDPKTQDDFIQDFR
jgi:hypothetical protein